MEPVRHFIAKDRLASDERIDLATGERLKTVGEAVVAAGGNSECDPQLRLRCGVLQCPNPYMREIRRPSNPPGETRNGQGRGDLRGEKRNQEHPGKHPDAAKDPTEARPRS